MFLLQVSKREYDDCNIYSDSSSLALPIVNCSNPKSRKVFSLLFDPFSSIPNVPEYEKGGTYYFISEYTNCHSNSIEGVCMCVCACVCVCVCVCVLILYILLFIIDEMQNHVK